MTQLLPYLATAIEERVAELGQLAYFWPQIKSPLTQSVSYFSLLTIPEMFFFSYKSLLFS